MLHRMYCKVFYLLSKFSFLVVRSYTDKTILQEEAILGVISIKVIFLR